MATELSPFIQSFFSTRETENRRVYNTHFAIEIALRSGAILPLASGDVTLTSLSRRGASTVLAQPINFEPRFVGSPEIRHSQNSSAPDAGEIEVINLDYLLSALIPSSDRVYDRAPVTCYLCFPKPDGTYEGLIVFVGNLRSIAGDDEYAQMSVIHDLSDKTATLGREITQRCGNILGDAWCGVNNLPVNAFCSLVFDDDDAGCGYWGGIFNGVPFINVARLLPQSSAGDGNIGNGWERDNWGCPSPESFVLTPSGGCRAEDLKPGDLTIDHRGRLGEVVSNELVWSDYRYRVSTVGGAHLICSASHPLLTFVEDEKGTPASAIVNGKHSLVEWQRGISVLTPFYELQPLHGDFVSRITLSAENRIIVAGETKSEMIVGHNSKGIVDLYNSILNAA